MADLRADARPFPDFVGLGALKAGTSYLDALLREHPGLSLPLHMKELEYFSRHVNRGVDWYRGQFAPDDGRPRGEISPHYLFDPDCPARIASANSAARLIVSVRHPVRRLVSQYWHWVRETGYGGGFEAFLSEHPGALARSNYWPLLQRYRVLFPDEQICVLIFEDLIADPVPVVQRVFGFLGVDSDFVPASIGQPVNASSQPRFPRLYVQSKKVSRWLYAHGAGVAVDVVKRRSPAAMLRSGTPRAQPPAASLEVLAGLAAQFRADAAELSSYLDRDLIALWEL